MRINEKPLEPWVACHADGMIETALCTCMAGLGRVCSHAAALMFAIEACECNIKYALYHMLSCMQYIIIYNVIIIADVTVNREILCMSLPSSWGVPSTSRLNAAEPMTVAQLCFRHKTCGNSDGQSVEKKMKFVASPTDQEKAKFYNALAKSGL